MSLPRQWPASTLLKILFVCACLFGAGTRKPFPVARAQEEQERTAQPTAATTTNVLTPPDTARAIKLYNENDYNAAIDILRGAVKRRKDDAQAWLHLGIAFSRAGKSKDARKAFERATKLSPNTPQAYIGMAYIFLDEDALPEAERHALRAVAVDASNAEAHYVLGLIALRQNSAAKALAEAETALRLNPKFAGALILKSEAAMEVYTATYVEQVEKYRALNQPVPALSPEERSRMSKMLTEAAESLENYIKLSPSSPGAARLREQAETLRWHAETANQRDTITIYTATEVTTRANILSKPEPLYTERARSNGISGTVRLRMLLSFDGRVRQIRVLKGLGGGLTEMAINAARAIKFTPATKDGRPVSQFVTIEYNFNVF
ncbi:MAG TPA: TonB family protein [Pyrinomonadaceae bacterium]|jgi:TonB family protein|nr:TonB family protein [Pyrinomonadaceae bacterium]